MNWRWWVLLLAVPAWSHTISISHGELRIEGSTAVYQLRIPSYELPSGANPEQTLFATLHFFSRGVEGSLIQRACRDDGGVYTCEAIYHWTDPVDTVRVDCRLARVTVANHIHLLRAFKGAKTDQAVFDRSIETAELRFRPPTAFEAAIKDVMAGVIRSATSLPGLLFLIALAMASRSFREFGACLLAFLMGELVSCVVLPHVRFDPSTRFIEAAMALTIAYLAVEVIFLPNGSARWLVCLVLGIFHGLYFALLVREGDFRVGYVLAGAFLVESIVATLVYLVRRRIPILARGVSALLLAMGLGWFVLRLVR